MEQKTGVLEIMQHEMQHDEPRMFILSHMMPRGRVFKRRERIFRTFTPVVMKSPVSDVLPLKCLHSRLPPRLRQHTAVKQR